MMECNGEISDTDSGIILHSGSDSPTTHTKDVTTHTRAMKLKHQALQDRLELCVLELKKLCIREAELTGQLSADYPLLPGEKLPQVRRRIGAAFKLDEQSMILQGAEESELNSVDAELSLQMKIYEASRKLLQEDHLHKGLKKSRLQQCKREERKLKDLQDTSFQLRLQRGRNVALHDQGNSDDSSLSDSAVLDEEAPSQGPHGGQTDSPPPPAAPLPASSQTPSSSCHTPPCATPSPLTLSHRHTSHTSLESSQSFSSSVELYNEAPPIPHSDWTESSLDQPYEKKKKSRSSTTSSKCSSPASPQVLPPLDASLVGPDRSAAPLPQKMSHLKLRHTVSNSTPCTPEMQVRRQLSLRLPNHTEPSYDQENRGRVRGPRRRLTEYAITLPESSPTVAAMKGGGSNYGSHASEDSNSEHSSSTTSYASSPCQDLPPPCGDLLTPKQYHQYHHQPGGPPPPAFQQQQQHFSPIGAPLGMGVGPPPFPNPPNGGGGGGFYQNPRHQSSPSFHRGYYGEEVGGGYPPPLDHVDHMAARSYYGTVQHHQAPCPPSRHDYSPNYRYIEAPVHHPHPHHRGALPPPQPQHRALPPRGTLTPPDVRLSRSPSLWEHQQQHQQHQQHQQQQQQQQHYQANSGLPRQVVNEELCSWHQRSATFRGAPGGPPPPRPRSLDRQGAVRVKNPAAGRESPLFHRRQYQPEQMNQRRVLHHQRPVVDDSPVRCWAADDNSEIFSQV